MQLRLEEFVLWVRDLDLSVAFYRDRLGLSLAIDREHWKVFDTGAVRLCLRPRSEPYAEGIERAGRVEGHPGSEVVFRTTELDDLMHVLAGQGVSIELPPTEMPYGRIASLRDPDGYSVTLFEAPN
ncbi:MAG: VOC family protein [Planctomycetota bacterium]